MACLFCFTIVNRLHSQAFHFDTHVLKAYQHTLNFEFDKSAALISVAKMPAEKYVQNLNETLELLLTEDPQLFSKYESRFEERDDTSPSTDVERFVAAEMNLQWAFVYLKFGHELDAASHFRKAYKIAMDCRKKHPNFLPIRKTTGVLEIMVGAVPEKYNWIMELFGIRGSIANGFKDLQHVKASNEVLASEARLIKALIDGYILSPTAASAIELSELIKRDTTNAAKFGAASLLVKAAQSERAFKLLNKLNGQVNGTPLEHYVYAEVLLHRGNYANAIAEYKNFLTLYKGNNNIKDALYKIGVCYRLLGNPDQADSAFAVARIKGNETIEADRSAARNLSLPDKANLKLLKARYYIDGGYYDEASVVLTGISDQELLTRKDKVEYFYRKARLEHGSKHMSAAKLFYQQVIDMSGQEHWYFPANACLQMGYLSLQENQIADARKFFKKALSYKGHEYKNSIDSKAKTALNQLDD